VVFGRKRLKAAECWDDSRTEGNGGDRKGEDGTTANYVPIGGRRKKRRKDPREKTGKKGGE